MTEVSSDSETNSSNYEMKYTDDDIKEENYDSKEFVIESSLLNSILPKPPKVIRILPKMTKASYGSETNPSKFGMKYTSNVIKEDINDRKEFVIESSLLDSILLKPPTVIRILPIKVNSDSEMKPANFEMKYTINSIKDENNDSKELVIESSLLDSISPKPSKIIRILPKKARKKVKKIRVKQTFRCQQSNRSRNFFSRWNLDNHVNR